MNQMSAQSRFTSPSALASSSKCSSMSLQYRRTTCCTPCKGLQGGGLFNPPHVTLCQTAQRSSVREQCLAGHSEAVFTPAGSLRMHQAAAADSKFASISRLLFIAQPHRVFRTVFRRGSKAGPIGVLLFFFGLLAAVLSAIQKTLAYRVRTCKCCRGYGIVRCSLCAGAGKVGWTAKFSYEDGCPMCMAKRYVDCPDCGGIIKRSLFPSGRNPPPGMEEPSFKRRTA